jgi:hypothetical protein
MQIPTDSGILNRIELIAAMFRQWGDRMPLPMALSVLGPELNELIAAIDSRPKCGDPDPLRELILLLAALWDLLAANTSNPSNPAALTR